MHEVNFLSFYIFYIVYYITIYRKKILTHSPYIIKNNWFVHFYTTSFPHKFFVLIFSFILILPIFHFKLTSFIVETIIGETVLSQLITIWLIKFVRSVHIHTTLYTDSYFIIVILIFFCRSFLVGHNLRLSIALFRTFQGQWGKCCFLFRL